MATTHPIKNKEDIKALENYFLNEKRNLRNYALIITGINTALRIGDTLHLQWNDVYDDATGNFRTHIIIREHKTGKENVIAVNQNTVKALTMYRESLESPQPYHYIFCGRNPNTPLSRSWTYRIVKEVAEALHLSGNISCHSLRKTFGYHAWISGTNPVLLMQIYNHSSFRVTKRYLGIEQDEKDQVFLNMNL